MNFGCLQNANALSSVLCFFTKTCKECLIWGKKNYHKKSCKTLYFVMRLRLPRRLCKGIIGHLRGRWCSHEQQLPQPHSLFAVNIPRVIPHIRLLLIALSERLPALLRGTVQIFLQDVYRSPNCVKNLWTPTEDFSIILLLENCRNVTFYALGGKTTLIAVICVNVLHATVFNAPRCHPKDQIARREFWIWKRVKFFFLFFSFLFFAPNARLRLHSKSECHGRAVKILKTGSCENWSFELFCLLAKKASCDYESTTNEQCIGMICFHHDGEAVKNNFIIIFMLTFIKNNFILYFRLSI